MSQQWGTALNGAPTDFWGKHERDPETSKVIEWHPLIDHCADVAACAAALLRLPTWRHRLARFCGREELDEVTCARLTVLAALHDLGKFNLGFQAKGRPELGVTAGHVREALGAIGQDVLRAVEPLGDWGAGTTGLLVAAICHHGRPYSFEHAVSFGPRLWEARGGLDPQGGVNRLVAVSRAWFPLAFDAQEQSFPENPGFEHAYAGLVMLADWLGSDRSIFAYSKPGDRDRMEFARDAAKQFVADSWLDIDDARRADRAERNAFGFVHEDSSISFCLDIADVFREQVALPAAFRAVKEKEQRPDEPLERLARRQAGRALREGKVIPAMIDRIKSLFEATEKWT